MKICHSIAAMLFAVLTFEIICCAETVSSDDGQMQQKAYEQLLSAKFFAFGGVGFAGTTPDGEVAFRTLLASTNALSFFQSAQTNENTAARLYALSGIHKLAPESFESFARPLAVANPKVMTMSGCIGMEEGASNIILRIRGGFYDSSINDWKK
jgi:hypothetical protein